MTNRPTKTFKTQNGTEIEMKTYLVQSERVQVQKLLSEETSLGGSGSQTVKTDNLITALDRAIDLAIVKVNGSEENIKTRIMDELPSSDYDEIVVELTNIIRPNLPTAK